MINNFYYVQRNFNAFIWIFTILQFDFHLSEKAKYNCRAQDYSHDKAYFLCLRPFKKYFKEMIGKFRVASFLRIFVV